MNRNRFSAVHSNAGSRAAPSKTVAVPLIQVRSTRWDVLFRFFRSKGFPSLVEIKGGDVVVGFVGRHHGFVFWIDGQIAELFEDVMSDGVARRHIAVIIDTPYADETLSFFGGLEIERLI